MWISTYLREVSGVVYIDCSCHICMVFTYLIPFQKGVRAKTPEGGGVRVWVVWGYLIHHSLEVSMRGV